MTNQQPTKLSKPGKSPLHDPAALVASHLTSIFIAPVLIVLSVWRKKLDAAFLHALAQRIRIVSGISNYPFWFLPGTALGPRHADFGQRGFRKRNFMRRGTFQPNSQRKTLTVDQYHPLRPLAPLGFTDGSAPFFAGAKLPSKKVSSHSSRPLPSSPPSIARHAASQTPCSSHCRSRRQQVDGEGYSSGRKRHAAPVCRIHKIPSKQSRFLAHGRPRWSGRRFGRGNNGSINSHCSSLNSFCRSFITEAHHATTLPRKYLM